MAELRITVPGGIYDMSGVNQRQNAPRALREVKGDFTFEVAVTGDFDPGSEGSPGSRSFPFNGAGILLWMGPDEFLRFERDIWIADGQAQGYKPLVEHWKGGRPHRFEIARIPEYSGRTTHLRMKREGSSLDLDLSHDGRKWIDIANPELEMPETVQVGVAAINTSARPFAVTFRR